MKEPEQLDLVEWIEEHSKAEQVMPPIQKIDEFEHNSYKQKDGSPKNISELIRGHNILVDTVNWLVKKNQELELKNNELQRKLILRWGGKDDD